MKQSDICIHFFWHQHQPWYPAPGSGMCSMPWTRLHGVKDYYDMAALCSQFEGWTQTINLVPSLLEQIIGHGDGSITDRYFELSRKPAADLTDEEKEEVVQSFFDAHAPRMIHVYPRYDELFRKRDAGGAEAFTTQDLLDLQVWFNLAWVDPIWRPHQEHFLQNLMDQQRGFSEEDKHKLLQLHLSILNEIIPIHKRLYENGSLELTTTPYYHPILPLLCDSSIAKISNPRDPVPDPPFQYPEDAEWHIREGKAYFETVMELQPQGVWPSEGSVSDTACALLAKHGFNYFATSQDILFRSTWTDRHHQPCHPDLYRLHQLQTPHANIDCVFRDQHLSDLIGFHFANRDAKDAAKEFIKTVKARTADWKHPHPPLVNVILDGENCWEFYLNDGHDFLRYLIEGILRDPQLQPTTVPRYREQHPTEEPTLTSIFPGSWIAHNFRIWIGHPEDNAAWHYLRQARERLCEQESSMTDDLKQEAWKEIHICEGSDWYWWFGDENASAHDALFDEQFRLHLSRVYTLLEQPVPEELKRPIKRLTKDGYSGAVFLHPLQLDPSVFSYYPWAGTRPTRFQSGTGAMHQAGQLGGTLRFGRYQNQLYFLIDFETLKEIPDQTEVQITVTKPKVETITIRPLDHAYRIQGNQIAIVMDLSPAALENHQELWFFMTLTLNEEQKISIPSSGELYAPAYTSANANPLWFA